MSDTRAYQNVELRVFLLRNGLSYRKVAKLLGISKTYVNQVFQHDRPAQHIRSRMVTELGIPAELVEYRPEVSKAA